MTTDERVFYGPHPCEACGKAIAKASREQGGEEFDYPESPIYPNTKWEPHNCHQSQVVSFAPGSNEPPTVG